MTKKTEQSELNVILLRRKALIGSWGTPAAP